MAIEVLRKIIKLESPATMIVPGMKNFASIRGKVKT